MSFLTFPEANTEIAQEFVVITEWKKKTAALIES